jgi:hypothetical protein
MTTTPGPAGATRLIGHDRRFAEAVRQIDSELDYLAGDKVAARRDEVVAAARGAYGVSPDFQGVRNPWDTIFPDGVYSSTGLAAAVARAQSISPA